MDALDRLKKGNSEVNVGARNTIRYLDSMLKVGYKTSAGIGLHIQGTREKYPTWADFLAAAPATPAPAEGDFAPPTPPGQLRDLLGCALYFIKTLPETCAPDDKVLFVTNSPQVRDLAEDYGIPTVDTYEMTRMVERENIEFVERKRHYDYKKAAGPMRGGRGGGGGRGVRGGRLARIDSRGTDDAERGQVGRGSRRSVGPVDPDFVLRGPTRGVARGRGRLWEP